MSTKPPAIVETAETGGDVKPASKSQAPPPPQNEAEMVKKYGLKPKSVAQRKISSGGKQYFDSGDYNMQDRKGKKQMAANLPPHLARLRGSGAAKPPPPTSGLTAHKAPPSQLGAAAQQATVEP